MSAWTGCASLSGLDEKQPEATASAHDASAPPHDAGATKDAGTPCTPDEAGYNDPQNLSCWSTFVIPYSLDMNAEYYGGAFDGRYTYFASNLDGQIVRYDTTLDFVAPASWSSYNTQFIPDISTASVFVYAGAVFDGRFMYFVPANPGMSFVRYDTTKPFEECSSWNIFNIPSNDAVGYYGGTYDGRYVYFAPDLDNNDDASGIVARFDTQGSFVDAASWSTFDLGGINPPATAMNEAVFDGRYVYLLPGYQQMNDAGVSTYVAARFDTTGAFAVAASWESFDLGSLPVGVSGFQGGMFDGTYVYVVPEYESGAVLRFDPSGSFGSKASWSAYAPDQNLGPVDSVSTPEFAGAAFDGRHLYFVPDTPSLGTETGVLVEHDLLAGPFAMASSWSAFDTSRIHASEFGAAVFDGKYLYLAPGLIGVAFARFQARATPSQPALPAYFGSFF